MKKLSIGIICVFLLMSFLPAEAFAAKRGPLCAVNSRRDEIKYATKG